MRYGYFIGIGSNVDPAGHLAKALLRLVELVGHLDVSRIIETAPVDLPSTAQFFNAVAYFESSADLCSLKAELNRIEAALGRDRADPNRARKDRTIDLDILLQVPAATRTLTADEITSESYHRPLFIELARVLGFACPVSTEPRRGAKEILCAGRTAGLTPFQLQHGPTPPQIALSQRRAALVTGAGVRLGKAIAGSLARAGYDIALHYNTSRAAAEAAAEEFRTCGIRCELFPYDLGNAEDIGSFIDRVADHLPHLSVLVNSASVYDHGRIADTTTDMLDRQWGINFKAPFFLMKEFRRRIEHGSIINILDNKVAFNQFHYAAYLSSKKALADLTRMAALEFAPQIRVNAVAPGVVLPANTRDQAYLEWRRAAIPVNRLGAPEQVCAMIAAVLDNPFMTGQILFVDGGEGMNLVGRNALEFGAGPTA